MSITHIDAIFEQVMQPYPFTIHNQLLWLSPESCLYWESEKTLIVSDIHFGKSGHFRKEGIGIPQTVFKEDLQKLFAQIQFFKAQQLIVVGDFFHSHINSEVLLFEKWRKDISELPIQLVRGNHDVLTQSWYTTNHINVHNNICKLNSISFIHEFTKEQAEDETQYFFSGHLHPGVRIDGLARQSLRFPCFYFTPQYAVLPAFGRFTGLHTIKPQKKDKVFAIINKKIVALNK